MQQGDLLVHGENFRAGEPEAVRRRGRGSGSGVAQQQRCGRRCGEKIDETIHAGNVPLGTKNGEIIRWSTGIFHVV